MWLCYAATQGSASLVPFASAFPEQFVEVGLRSRTGKHFRGHGQMRQETVCGSPASFISTRSFEQAGDVAYSNTNVKLIESAAVIRRPGHEPPFRTGHR